MKMKTLKLETDSSNRYGREIPLGVFGLRHMPWHTNVSSVFKSENRSKKVGSLRFFDNDVKGAVA